MFHYAIKKKIYFTPCRKVKKTVSFASKVYLETKSICHAKYCFYPDIGVSVYLDECMCVLCVYS